MNACMLLEKLILIRSRLITNYIYATIQKICIKVMKTFIRERRNTLFKSDKDIYNVIYLHVLQMLFFYTFWNTYSLYIMFY